MLCGLLTEAVSASFFFFVAMLVSVEVKVENRFNGEYIAGPFLGASGNCSSFCLLSPYFFRHKALKDLKDEIFNRHFNLKEMASGLVLPCDIYVRLLSRFLF